VSDNLCSTDTPIMEPCVSYVPDTFRTCIMCNFENFPCVL